jgi:hypothetical protein
MSGLGAVGALYQLSFQISPIILTGGVAQLIPGGMLPIVSIMQAASFIEGLLGGSNVTDLNQYFAHFKPLPGGKMLSVQYAMYPFANQQVAANAAIFEPLRLSMLMQCPASDNTNFVAKFATLTAVKAVLNLHGAQGGTYSVATPSLFYDNGLLTDVTDVTAGQPGQPQRDWQWDFVFPLLTQQQAVIAMNGMMSSLNNATPSTGATSGPEVVSGSPSSLAGSSLIPAAANSQGTAAAGIPQ